MKNAVRQYNFMIKDSAVIAYGRGGALETALENKTSIFFKEQTVESLIEAVNVVEKDEDRFDCNEIRKNAERFSKARFKREFKELLSSLAISEATNRQ